MTRTHPLRSTLLFMIAVIAGAFALSTLYHLGVAHAGVLLAAPPDPVVVATGATNASWSLVTDYGPLWGGALLLYGLIQTFISKQHWLAQGRLLAIITGVAMTGGAVLDWHFHGAAFAGIVVTAVMAIKLVWSPTVAPTVPERSIQAGYARMSVLMCMAGIALVLTLLAMAPSCATLRDAPADAEHALIDCTKADGTAIAELVSQLGAEATLSALGVGHIDWSRLASDALAQGKVIGGCALAQFVAGLASDPASRSTTQSVRPGDGPVVEGRATLERFRATVGGGRWRVADGAVL